jgi:hypothetical protein
MKTAAELIAVAAAMAVALLIERWATPWTEALSRKGTLTPYQCNKIWAIAVVGSGWIAWLIIQPFALDWLK